MRFNLTVSPLAFTLFLALILAAVIPAAPARADTDGNDSFAQAVEISAGVQNQTTMSFVSDKDYFKITIDHTCSICTILTTNGSAVYYKLYNSSQQQLQSLPISGINRQSYKVNAGTYYIRISDCSPSSGFSPYTVDFQTVLIEPDSLEANDTPGEACEASPGTTYTVPARIVCRCST